ncbi:L-asparagine oxygenase [Streptomyces aurantiacus]|uniref:TauD/TfdA family dioxygenase n=1 Tax=Streptomyces aurantiacus TaxID=47760 RepID=UPI0027939F8D|nr:TauD/TfdA family dioxygenase [Streptomyces aurantiacus]MDQ0776340.1 L-asparagine oxygenase [Streptomyces aurantiacus]
MRLAEQIIVRALDQDERAEVQTFLQDASHLRKTEPEIVDIIGELSCALPSRLVSDMRRFSAGGAGLVMKLKNIPQGGIGDLTTPETFGPSHYHPSEDHILYLALMNSIGYPVGWSTQQGGRLLNDIMPMHHRADIANSSNGYVHDFSFHTEDAFHPKPPDFFSLYCVRRSTGPGLTLAAIDLDTIDEALIAELRRPAYQIRPNPSQAAWDGLFPMLAPIVTGPIERPTLRFNGGNATACGTDKEAALAVEQLDIHLNTNIVKLDIEPGDVTIVDNQRVTHGRDSYAPQFDGRDRWLLRLVTYESLRLVWSDYQTVANRVISPRN